MRTFENIVAAWREARFPTGSKNDQLDEVHADLALIDSWVADSLLPYLQSQVWAPAVPDVFGALDQLERTLGELQLDVDERELAIRYVDYARILREAYDAFLKLGAQG